VSAIVLNHWFRGPRYCVFQAASSADLFFRVLSENLPFRMSFVRTPIAGNRPKGLIRSHGSAFFSFSMSSQTNAPNPILPVVSTIMISPPVRDQHATHNVNTRFEEIADSRGGEDNGTAMFRYASVRPAIERFIADAQSANVRWKLRSYPLRSIITRITRANTIITVLSDRRQLIGTFITQVI